MRHPFPWTWTVLIASSGSYFTSIFVSLGVFLFGYDQGVMSGIITYALHVPASRRDRC